MSGAAPADLRRQIERAGDGRLVRVARRKGWDRLDGSVTGSGPKWLLLALEVEAGFDGHVLVRVAHVRRLRRLPHAGFVERALESEGHWPLPRLEGLDLSTTRDVLRTLAARDELVAVHYELDHPDECVIGVPRAVGRHRVRLQTVDPDGAWDAEDTVLAYRSITRLDVGNAYERRLAAVAGPPPPWSSPQGRRRTGSRETPYWPVARGGRRG